MYSDAIHLFLVVVGKGRRGAGAVLSQELYAEYQKWATEDEDEPMTMKAFGTRLTEKGFQNMRTAPGGRYERHGIKVRETDSCSNL